MMKVDVTGAQVTESLLTECEREMFRLYSDVYEIKGQLREENGLYKLVPTLNGRLEELQRDMKALSKLTEGLGKVLATYVACEERNLVFTEEAEISAKMVQLKDVEIPDWLFGILRNN